MSFATIDSTNRLTLLHHPGDWFNQHGLNILIIIGGAWLMRRFGTAVVSGLLRRAVRNHSFATETDRKKRLATLESLIDAIVRIAVWLVATVMIIDELGINTGPLLASAGVVGVALGIGAQSFIKDFVNGVFIIAENQYRVGDTVTLNNVSGTVQAITVRTTVLRDIDGSLHHVPNGTITVATNKTYDVGKINEQLTIPLDTDLAKLEKIIAQVGAAMVEDKELGGKIRTSPKMGQVSGLSEKGLIVSVVSDTAPGAQFSIRSELYRRLIPAIEKAGIIVTSSAVKK